MKYFFLFFLLFASTILSEPKWIHDWKTISTKHFDIVYNPKYKKTAVKVAKIAESSYLPVSKSLGYFPTKTVVVLHTDNDMSNAFATPFPWRIELYVSKPVDNWLGANDDYIKTVFIHEFTHIVHKQKKSGFTSFVSYLVGQNYTLIHNLESPLWFQEGIAVYNETKFTNSGRLRNPYQLALFRAAINKTRWDYGYSYKNFLSSMYYLSRDYKTLYESNFYSRRDLPSGEYYDYGSNFVRFVSDKYGDGIWRKVIEDYTKNPFFTFDIGLKYRLEKYTNESVEELDYDARKKFNESKLQIENRDDEIVNYYNPRWNGNKLFAYKKSYNLLPQIVNIEGGVEREIYKYSALNDDNSFDIKNNMIVVSKYKINARDDDVIYNKLEIIDKNSSKYIKLNRVFSPDISSITSKIIAVENTPENSSMVIFSKEGKLLKTINLDGVRFSNPRWSNDESKIVYTQIDKKSRYNIAIYNIKTGESKNLYPSDMGIDNNACFSDDDKSVYYNSDRSGIPNIWVVDINSGDRRMVTDAQFSAMAPDVKDGKLAYITYTVNGYRVQVKDIDYYKQIDEKKVAIVKKKLNPKAIVINQDIDYKVNQYNPFKYIYPTSWGLANDGGYTGVGASGNDPLGHHFWSLYGMVKQTATGFVLNNNRYLFNYGYHRFWPKFDLNLDYRFDKSTYEFYKKYLITSASVNFPITLESGVYSTRFTPLFNLTNYYIDLKDYYKNAYKEGKFLTTSAGFSFSRLSYTPTKIVPNSGIEFSTNSGFSNERMGSATTNFFHNSIGGVYIPIIKNYVTTKLSGELQYYRNPSSILMYNNIQNMLPLGYYSNDISSDMYNNKYFIHPKLDIYFPVLSIEKRAFFFPIYIDYFSLNTFVESFAGRNDLGQNNFYYRGAGASLSFVSEFFQLLKLNIKFYYSYDWEEKTVKKGFLIYFFNKKYQKSNN